MQIDEETFKSCRVQDERLFLDICAVDTTRRDFPIPIQPITSVPRVAHVVAASNAILASLQAGMQMTLENEGTQRPGSLS